MTVLRSGGRITVMRLLRTKLKILIPILLVITAISAAVFIRQQKKILVIEELETGNVYREIPVKTGDELSFQWEHSFEHIPWYEYYEIQKDGSFILHTIAVAGLRRRNSGRDGLQIPLRRRTRLHG